MLNTIYDYGVRNPTYTLVAAALGAVLLLLGVRKTLTGRKPEDVLTFVVAGMATGASAQGMWRFFGDSLDVKQVYLRGLMFAMYEAAMLVCALRARRAIKDGGSAGIEGLAVWVMAAMSGVLAATDVATFGGALARLAAPLVAAFLWERGMSIARQKAGRATIHWRVTPERILVKLGLAESTARTTSDVDAHRRITRVALAAEKVDALREADAWEWRQQWAKRKLRAAMRAAVDEPTNIATDRERQRALMAQLGALHNTMALADVRPPAPWDPSVRSVDADRTPIRTDAPQSVPPVRTEPHMEAAPVRTEAPAPSVRTDRSRALESVRRIRTEPSPSVQQDRTDTADIDRDALVAELTGKFREAVAAGEKWSPDYNELQQRTGRGRSWCEKVVADAKRGLFPADDPVRTAQLLGLRTPPRMHESVNGHDLASVRGA